MADSERTSAYADLLAALVAVRSDPATARFDAELAAAEATGTLDGVTARTLRWWQRESVRALNDHLADVLPGLLAALVEADRSAALAVAESARSWATATAHPPAAPPSSGDATLGHPVAVPDSVATTDPVTGAPARPDPAAPAPEAGLFGRTERAEPPPAPAPGPAHGPTAQGADYGAPRRRLLVAGLTVLGDGNGPDPAPPVPMT